MIHDLNTADQYSLQKPADVCIVGGGTAGLYLANALWRQGLQVVVLEGGARTPAAPSDFGICAQQVGIRYRGAEQGRSFGLGGTSVLWGGQMIPVTRSDISERAPAGFAAWPIAHDELLVFIERVRRRLGLGRRPLEQDSALIARRYPQLRNLSPELNLRLSEWIPFRSRNMAQAFHETLARSDGPAVWLNAAASHFELARVGDRHVITAVVARSSGDHSRTIRISPRTVVVAAGALESTRLLLELDAATDHLITQHGAPLGRFFSDHLSVPCGRFHCHRWKEFNSAVAPIFVRSIMRSPRLELTAAAQASRGLPSAFAHITFHTRGDTGFDVVRNLLRRRQGERRGLGLSLSNVGTVVRDVTAMTGWRYLDQRLWIPRTAELQLQVDIEQTPNPESRLYLSNEFEKGDRRQLIIDWRIQPTDIEVIQSVIHLVAEGWQRSPLGEARSSSVSPAA
jgi:hypothetical protein